MRYRGKLKICGVQLCRVSRSQMCHLRNGTRLLIAIKEVCSCWAMFIKRM